MERSLEENPRPLFVIYHNPLLEEVLAQSTHFRKNGGTQQYSIHQAG
jgi:hypothetical protein